VLDGAEGQAQRSVLAGGIVRPRATHPLGRAHRRAGVRLLTASARGPALSSCPKELKRLAWLFASTRPTVQETGVAMNLMGGHYAASEQRAIPTIAKSLGAVVISSDIGTTTTSA